MNDLTIDNNILPVFDSVLDLGVTIDCSLTFAKHIINIVGSARQRIFLILRSFHCRDITLLVYAYTIYIKPVLEYCSPIWSPSRLCDIDLLEGVQRYYTKRLQGLWVYHMLTA